METTNQDVIDGIETNIPKLNDKIKNGIEEYKNYLEVLKFEEFNEDLNETEDQSIKKAESILDRLDEMIKRNGIANKELKEIVEVFKKIINNIENEKEKLAERNNEIIDNIIDLEKRKVNKLILQNPRKKNGLKGDLEDKKEEWNEHRIITEKIVRKKQQQEIWKKTKNSNDINQLEEWTGMKIGNIIFDSNIDNWNINTSVFGEKILNKSNLIFLIEDEIGNLFGGYINAKIHFYDGYLGNAFSFAFSFKPNEMLKHHIGDSQNGLKLYNQSDERLFDIKGSKFSLHLFKEEKKHESFRCKKSTETQMTSMCYQMCTSVINNEITYFTTRRLWVIQLV